MNHPPLHARIGRHPFALLVLLTCVLMLAACGGGGKDDSQTGATNQPAIWDDFDWDQANWS